MNHVIFEVFSQFLVCQNSAHHRVPGPQSLVKVRCEKLSIEQWKHNVMSYDRSRHKLQGR